MTRERLRIGLVVAGMLVVLVGLVLGLVLSPRPAPDGPTAVSVLVVLIGAVVALAKILRSGSGGRRTPPPWTADGAIVQSAPETGPEDERVSGTALTSVVEAGGKRARRAGTVEAGLSTVRPALRETLHAALVQGGRDREAAERALADGSWTDDQAAAALLDEQVTPPERTFRRRLWAWLFPERAVRRRTARAVRAIGDAADESLPPVIGQDAPRSVPVVTPTLDDLRRTADGRLQRAEAIGASDRRDRGTSAGSSPSVEPDTGGTDASDRVDRSARTDDRLAETAGRDRADASDTDATTGGDWSDVDAGVSD